MSPLDARPAADLAGRLALEEAARSSASPLVLTSSSCATGAGSRRCSPSRSTASTAPKREPLLLGVDRLVGPLVGDRVVADLARLARAAAAGPRWSGSSTRRRPRSNSDRDAGVDDVAAVAAPVAGHDPRPAPRPGCRRRARAGPTAPRQNSGDERREREEGEREQDQRERLVEGVGERRDRDRRRRRRRRAARAPGASSTPALTCRQASSGPIPVKSTSTIASGVV